MVASNHCEQGEKLKSIAGGPCLTGGPDAVYQNRRSNSASGRP